MEKQRESAVSRKEMSRHGMEGGSRSCIRRSGDDERSGRLLRMHVRYNSVTFRNPEMRTLPKEKKVKIPLPRERVD